MQNNEQETLFLIYDYFCESHNHMITRIKKFSTIYLATQS